MVKESPIFTQNKSLISLSIVIFDMHLCKPISIVQVYMKEILAIPFER